MCYRVQYKIIQSNTSLLTFICLRATSLSYDVAHWAVRSWRQNSFRFFSRWPWNTLSNSMCGVACCRKEWGEAFSSIFTTDTRSWSILDYSYYIGHGLFKANRALCNNYWDLKSYSNNNLDLCRINIKAWWWSLRPKHVAWSECQTIKKRCVGLNSFILHILKCWTVGLNWRSFWSQVVHTCSYFVEISEAIL
jgi:hypothetical protein